MPQIEEWRDIPGYEGRYQASTEGRIRSLDRVDVRVRRGQLVSIRYKGKVISPGMCFGYEKVALSTAKGEKVRAWVHRLVCMTFHGGTVEGSDVAHGDGDRSNNRPSNLRWATRLENNREKAIHGRQPRGEKIWLAKLTDDVVRKIRCSRLSDRKLARQFGVNHGTVRSARIGLTWRHVGAA